MPGGFIGTAVERLYIPDVSVGFFLPNFGNGIAITSTCHPCV
jgi:hypothetical protein